MHSTSPGKPFGNGDARFSGSSGCAPTAVIPGVDATGRGTRLRRRTSGRLNPAVINEGARRLIRGRRRRGIACPAASVTMARSVDVANAFDRSNAKFRAIRSGAPSAPGADHPADPYSPASNESEPDCQLRACARSDVLLRVHVRRRSRSRLSRDEGAGHPRIVYPSDRADDNRCFDRASRALRSRSSRVVTPASRIRYPRLRSSHGR